MSSNNACDYTPGPWHCEYFPNSICHWDVTHGPADNASERFSVLEDLSEADARLIAATPLLLEACGTLLDAAGIDDDTILTGSDEAEFYSGNGTRLPLGIITAIRLAIRKATGEKP